MAWAFFATVVNKASALLNSVQEPVASPREMNAVAGRACQNEVRRHLFRNERERPNKQGWPRQHFWAAAARSISFKVLETYAVIGINKVGVRQQWQGGVIVPRTTQFLTLPARAEAYGKRAREFSLKFGFAVDEDGRARPALLDGSTVYFWLVRRVTQAGDRAVLPTSERLTEVGVKAVRMLIATREQRGREGGGETVTA